MSRPYSVTVVVGEGESAKHRQIGVLWKNERDGRYVMSGHIYFGGQKIYVFPPSEDGPRQGGYGRDPEKMSDPIPGHREPEPW